MKKILVLCVVLLIVVMPLTACTDDTYTEQPGASIADNRYYEDDAQDADDAPPSAGVRVTIEEWDGVSAAALELIYEDAYNRYYLSSIRSAVIMLTFEDGLRISLSDAIAQNKISMEDLIASGLQVIIKRVVDPVAAVDLIPDNANAPARTPLLYATVISDGLAVQHFQTLQLSNSWSTGTFTDADGNMVFGPEYCASSFHPLDVWALDILAWLEWEDDAVTIRLDGADVEVALQFSDDFPPDTIYARRWPAEFADSVNDGGSDMGLWFQYEPVEISGNIIRVRDDGNDYIYEIEAMWRQGRSSYTFRVESSG